MLIFTTSFNITVEVLAIAVRQETDVEGIPNRKEEVKLFLFAKIPMKLQNTYRPKWRDITCSWIRKLNITKMSVITKIIYEFNMILTNT